MPARGPGGPRTGIGVTAIGGGARQDPESFSE